MYLKPFVNEPFLNFSDPATRASMEEAVRQVGGKLGAELPLVIGGERVKTGNLAASYNPNNLGEVICRYHEGRPEDVDRALNAAWDAFPRWSRLPVEERVYILLRGAEIARRRKLEMLAWAGYEVGKNWAEAEGEYGEVIDHFEWCAREALRYAQGQPLPAIPGETSEYVYYPIGAGAVISPWNFPFALASGMILGAIAAGCTVVCKPAEDATACAHALFSIMEEAGVPPGVVNIINGLGPVVGNALVEHPQTRWVSFVGSKDVGVQVYQKAAVVKPGQVWLKRVICEMGGKNATIVAEDADLDAAARHVVQGAFGYQGQKCSAGSRLIAVGKAYTPLLERVEALARNLSIGPAYENYPLGPVINKKAEEKVLSYIGIGKGEAKLVTGGSRARDDGHYIAPTLFADADPSARIMQEEIFGPVVAATHVKDVQTALQVANNVEFGLTGSVFSRDPAVLALAKDQFHVGNLYFNRRPTGAMAGVHPFGGYKMSGTGPKVGGPDYLLAYLEAKTVVRSHF